jgi:O-antigen ligase/polysaccharide polymerase Wzy-like membrane protein
MKWIALILAVSLGLGFGISKRASWPVMAIILFLCNAALYPKAFSTDPNLRHVGIAQSVPALTTYALLLMLIAYALVLRLLHRPTSRSFPISIIVFLGFLAIAFSTIWTGTEEQVAGALQLVLGFCGWFVGAELGPRVLSHERRVRWIATTIAGIASIEVVVTALQRVGLRINPMRPQLAAIMGDRTNGTANHPDNLGKILLLLLILALGFMGTKDPRTRRILWIAVLLSFIPLGLSQGRANILAAFTTVVFWALLSGRRWPLALRAGIPIAMVLVILPFAGSIVKRVEEDPNGGPREGLAATAVEQIHRNPWGVGPNSYVSVVSAYNAVTATGYPVHNTFLLTAAELGLLGAALFWIPIAGLIVAAWLSRRRAGFEGSFAVAILASAPGLYVVNASGWAMLSNQLLPLWFLICGIAYSQIRLGRGARLSPRGTWRAWASDAPTAYLTSAMSTISPGGRSLRMPDGTR